MEASPWGIAPFDSVYAGLPKHTFNLLRTCDKESLLSAVGHFLKIGLTSSERVVLVGSDNPSSLFTNLSFCGFSFQDDIESERLVYLNYKHSFSDELSFTVNYQELFQEILRISGNGIARIAFLQADALFNLQSYLLTLSSAEKIMSAAAKIDACILAAYQYVPGPLHDNFDMVAAAVLESYVEISSLNSGSQSTYELVWRKHPLPEIKEATRLCLTQGQGFNDCDTGLLMKHA